MAELELPLSENTDVAWAEVQVLPEPIGAAVSAAPCGRPWWTAPVPPTAPGSGER